MPCSTAAPGAHVAGGDSVQSLRAAAVQLYAASVVSSGRMMGTIPEGDDKGMTPADLSFSGPRSPTDGRNRPLFVLNKHSAASSPDDGPGIPTQLPTRIVATAGFPYPAENLCDGNTVRRSRNIECSCVVFAAFSPAVSHDSDERWLPADESDYDLFAV